MASENSPLYNPALVIKDFGTAEIELTINSQNIERGKNFRYGYENDDLVIWIKYEGTIYSGKRSLRKYRNSLSSRAVSPTATYAINPA